MKEKIIKTVLLIIGIIPFIWVSIISFEDYVSDIGNYLMEMLFKILQYPLVLLGIVPIFIAISMPSRNLPKKVDGFMSKEKNKKLIWIVLLFIGIIPFVIPLIAGIYDSITGFSGLCFIECDNYYGFQAFIDSIYLYSFIFWPTYIIGAILIILSIIKLKNKRK